ncbi:hypothetical protein BKP56_01205 [Marinilactibacillus sp. 15R]|uniref:Tagatose-6-phosphate kinase n=1 Tax=Marinilactibacillus piezotolerans TaxID=258723 RepID=A0A1I3ZR63_9LACT|nr:MULTISPECIES: 1-phosphofructokinase family hexose kinase [Marinilactibacillus]API88033.1 hypothetical protein BKP56_01205 [Marinilactibacillus sp. 15R]SFK46380.1 tagatose 6-phosphate kinase [Marinilactibacillus piezotolerans]
MILTITLNPSMDYIYHIDHFNLGKQNRFNTPTKMPGGKGINASRTIASLNTEVLAFIFLGGTNGKIIYKELQKEKFSNYHIKIEEESRNAITIMHDNETHTEIVEKGPLISEEKKIETFNSILEIISANHINIVSVNGSVNSENEFFYNELLEVLRTKINHEIIILMDVSKEKLKNIVNKSKYRPDFIKPNLFEFGELYDKEITEKSEVIEMLKLHNIDIPYVLVSCGGDGAVAKMKNKIYDVSIPSIQLVNPTGSGDATVGGVAYSFENHFSDEEILRQAMACGVANAMESGVGVVSQENVNAISKQITIKEVHSF